MKKIFLLTRKWWISITILITSNIIAQQNFSLAPEVWSEPIILDTAFARPYFWEESPSLTRNMDTMYFDRGNGAIHMTIKKDGKWKPSIKLNDSINGFYSKYRPSISKDGRRLYFSA